MRHRVAALIFDGSAPFELGVVVEVFGLARPELDVPWWYELSVCSPEAGRLRAVGDFQVETRHGLEAVAAADTVIVPAWPDLRAPVPADVTDALRSAHARGARLVSICSGAFVIAATGLLDGRRAATHWRYADELRRLHPSVAVDERVLYVDDGLLLTSAGSAAGLDLCLHLVRQDHGVAIANQVARRLVIAPHRAGDQSQFISRPVAPADDDRVRQAMEWALARLDRPMTLSDLSARAFMSPRTFSRRFREHVGLSPMSWLVAQRIDASLELLEAGGRDVAEVASAVGFQSAASYRKHFHRVMALSPTQYRRSFRAGG